MRYLFKTVVCIVLGIILMFQSKAQDYNAKTTYTDAGAKNSLDKKGARDSIVENVIIVYKTHFDIGYSETVQQVVHDYRTSMLDRVLEAIEENNNQVKEKQFVWTLSGWPMKQILWDGQTPWRKKKLEQAIIDGNLVVHALPFTIHTETSELEDMVRGLNISSTLARKYNQPLPISAKMTDVPGQSWLIPTLFTHAGIKFYHMGGPVVNIELELPPFFWWEGPDGSQLLTLYNNGYGTSRLPPDDWPYKTWIYLSMTGDNQGPPNSKVLANDLNYYNELGINASVGSMDDFAEEILKEDLSNLPVVRSDIGDPWIHGTMAMPEASKLAMNIRPSIGGLEQLTTLEKIWGIYQQDQKQIIAKAYESSLMYSEHTWGLANQHYLKVPYGENWVRLWEKGLPPQFKLMEKSWEDNANNMNRVKELVENPYLDAVATLADNVKLEENRIVVYNPLPWKRSGEIEIDTRLSFGNNFKSLKAVDDSSIIPVSHEYPAIEDAAPMSRFVAMDIPPLGYRTFVPTMEEAVNPELFADEEAGVIESLFFKATINAKKGKITSIIDKRTGKEMVDNEAPQGFGQYFYERFGYQQISDWIDKSLYPQYKAHRFAFSAYEMPRDVPYKSTVPIDMEFSVEKSAIDVKAIMTGTISGFGQPQKVTVSLTLSGSTPIVDIEVRWQKQPDTWPEAAWLCLPFKCNNTQFRLGRLGADVNPKKDMIVGNANYHMWWVNGVALYNDDSGSGYGVYSKDAPLVSIGEPGEYKFDKRYEPNKPYIYINLYNNHWRTNFPSWIGHGQYMSAKVRIWAFDNYSTESSLYSSSMETRISLRASCSKMKNGNLPLKQDGISLSRKGVAVTAFGPNPDGEGIILRLWEQVGNSDDCWVVLPKGFEIKSVKKVNLRGRLTGESITVVDGVIQLEMKKYAPVSIVLNGSW